MAIVLGLPKGSLQESTFALFKRAGFNVSCSSRSYVPSIDDPEIKCRLLRPQEMSRYVELGLLDAGICGYDWVYENGSDVQEVCELNYSKATSNPVRWVLAVPNDSKIKSVKDLQGKRIATEAIGLVKRYLKKHGVKADVEFSWGATEVKAPELVDAIADLTETGSSLRANNLRIVDTILTEARAAEAQRAREEPRENHGGPARPPRTHGQQARRGRLVRGRVRRGGAPGARSHSRPAQRRRHGHHRAAPQQGHFLKEAIEPPSE